MSIAGQPFYFGPEGAQLFGWLHMGAADARRGLGVVVCNPLGFEEVCAHRSLRHFAQALAEAGLPTLRFDHAGCGNSMGEETDADAPGRWLAGVHAAIDTLKAGAGVQQVVLMGVRMGAALAAQAASERNDIAGLVAIAPVVRGRGYVRELTMLGQSSAAESSADVGLLESAGFAMPADAAQALSQLDLRRLARCPAPRVLIVARDDLGTEVDWEPALQAQGAAVRTEHWPGYTAMMDDAQRSVVPERMVEGVAQCVQGWAAALGLPLAAPQPVGAETLVHPGPHALREAPVRVPTGSATSLFGVLATPQATTQPAGRPAVLLLNAGAVHHIGPNRLWVRLARHWAARGITVLRLDLAGLGDSPARPGEPDNLVYPLHAQQDIAAALDYLRREQGASECHLIGLCSGAYHALKAAVAAQPLASSIMLNPVTYFWTHGTPLTGVNEFQLAQLSSRYRSKFFAAETWLNLLRGKVDVRRVVEVALRRQWGRVSPRLLELARSLRIPLRQDLARELNAAAQAGIGLRFIFADNSPGLDLLHKEGGRAVDQLVQQHRASIDQLPNADHTFSRWESRERLVALLDSLVPLSRNEAA